VEIKDDTFQLWTEGLTCLVLTSIHTPSKKKIELLGPKYANISSSTYTQNIHDVMGQKNEIVRYLQRVARVNKVKKSSTTRARPGDQTGTGNMALTI
jgi:hypothetical protein